METDLHLLARYHRHGDADAFQALVAAHAGMVHATAQRVTRDMALAQDVVQETFLALARSSGAAIQSVGAWLHHVAWQKAQNVVRGEVRRHSYESAAAAQLVEPAVESTWSEIEPLLDEALAELPETTRTLLIERYLEGRTQQELAARRGVSQSTVSRQLDTAIHELRVRLRAKGVMCGVGLGALLSAHSVSAAPASVAAALGKVSISGLGTNAASTPVATITTTLIAMTTTTKLFLAAAAVAVVCIPFVFHQSPPPLPKKQLAQVNATPVGTKASDAKNYDDQAGHHYRPAPATREVRQKVDSLLRRIKAMTLKEMEKDAELNQLIERFTAVMNTPETSQKMQQRQDAILRRLGSKRELMRIDYSMSDNPEGRAFLEAMVSNDTERMEEYMLNKLDGAIFEFAFDPDLKRSSTGVSFQAPANAEPKAPVDTDRND